MGGGSYDGKNQIQIFSAPATMDGYYRAEVRHDMAVNAYGAT